MSSGQRPLLVVPGDDPVQIGGSPQLDRLADACDVKIFRDRPRNTQDLIARAKDATLVINSRGHVHWPAEVFAALPQLKMLSTCSIGTDSVDLPAARSAGVIVSNIPGRTAPVVAEHALALMLATARRLAFQTAELKAGRWTRMPGVMLSGKTLGVIGAGAIGRQVLKLGAAIGMKTQCWTFNPSPEREQELGVPLVAELDELLGTSDVISLHLRLTDQSRGLLGQREFELMKPGAILVNTARGPIVDTQAMLAALDTGRLTGAGLDVYDREPIPADHPLFSRPQLVLSPHSADQTPEGVELLNAGAVDNVLAFLQGKPTNVVS